MGDFKEKSFDFANEALKLILTLATGVLAFTIAFMKDMIGENPVESKGCLFASWGLIMVSIASCLWALFAIIGTANTIGKNTSANPSPEGIYDGNIKIPTVAAILFFIAGMSFMIVFTLNNFPSKGKAAEKKVEREVKTCCYHDSITVVVNVRQTKNNTAVIKSAKKTKRCKCR
ncbi:hypothetical protein IM793_18355 [Pedobacter sp. MR2016-19]|uniref:hypothetical protein n=1 Tax=Pedobacter sp. MR2016-19 TaxID=2780089 RepID=UPI00187346E0|nr:hypothetical protein [Pedobacter sp. MR2016-19]MBE5321131.1 hypothetical protein [Pedobacter sp. MR2016-19]